MFLHTDDLSAEDNLLKECPWSPSAPKAGDRSRWLEIIIGGSLNQNTFQLFNSASACQVMLFGIVRQNRTLG